MALTVRFESKMVPAYVRRAASVDAALPWLYLRRISQSDVGPALQSLVGKDVPNLSGRVISRLKRSWQDEHARRSKTDLSKDRSVYLWVDGIFSSIRRDHERLCELVIIEASERGQKCFLAIKDGVRESMQSWRGVLLGHKRRGLVAPRLAAGNAALGFWAATEEVLPATAAQHCPRNRRVLGTDDDGDDVQVGDHRPAIAPNHQGLQLDCRCDPQRALRRWRQKSTGARSTASRRRLMVSPRTQLLTVAPALAFAYGLNPNILGKQVTQLDREPVSRRPLVVA